MTTLSTYNPTPSSAPTVGSDLASEDALAMFTQLARSADVNPRYAMYAMAHGRSILAQQAFDDTTYPGGCMTGFILWIAGRKRAFAAAHPAHAIGENIFDQARFSRFLLHTALASSQPSVPAGIALAMRQ